MSRLGKLFIVAAPSGAGKTSLVNALIQQADRIQISISYTTRPPRPDDRDDVDYHFISEEDFSAMVTHDDFLEHAMVFGYHYGTGKKWVHKKLQQGIDVILEIDWQGARQVREQFPNSVSIFILPPSLHALLERLQARQQDKDEVIASRMAKSKSEIVHYTEFDYIVVNHDFNDAVQDLAHIVMAERLRLPDQCQEQAQLLAELL